MASLMENLIDVLNRECTEYEGLLGLIPEKDADHCERQSEDLQKITDDEQNVVIRINHLEKQRIEVTKDIANVLNRDVDNLKLTNLIDMLAGRPAEQEQLETAHDRLQTAVHGLQRVNEQNKELLTNALEMVEFEMTLLQSMKAAPETANYNRGAYTSGNTMGVPNRGFDAKQ